MATEGEGAEELRRVDPRTVSALGRYQMVTRAMPALWILAAWVPLQALTPIAKALAGKHTSVSAVFSVSIVFSVAIGGAFFAQARKLKAQRDELIRLRARCEQLETELSRQ